MEQRGAHAETAGAVLFECWSALVVLTGPEPSPPPLRRESRVVVVAAAQVVVLTPAKDTVGWLRGLVVGVVERLERPVVVEVDRVVGVHSLESVVERDRGRPHLGEHVVLHEVCLAGRRWG